MEADEKVTREQMTAALRSDLKIYEMYVGALEYEIVDGGTDWFTEYKIFTHFIDNMSVKKEQICAYAIVATSENDGLTITFHDNGFTANHMQYIYPNGADLTWYLHAHECDVDLHGPRHGRISSEVLDSLIKVMLSVNVPVSAVEGRPAHE